MLNSGRRWGVPRPRCHSRARGPSLRVVVLLSGTLLLVGLRSVPAQSRRPTGGLQVTPIRDLRFGTVIPGVITSVRPDQQRQSGLFGITGVRNMSVRIDILLPTAMMSMAGDQFPILFGRTDGSSSANRGRGRATPFDPHQPLITTLGHNGRLYVRLGGTVAPNRLQVGGAYSATITLTVANLGS